MDASETHDAAEAIPASERAYRHIKNEVMARRLASNEVFSEGLIADAVGVSRTPVREALLRLQSEGVVRLLPKRGALVLPITDAEREDVMQARHLVEMFAVRAAIGGGRTAALVADLEVQLTAMRAAARTRDPIAYSEADRAFHARIVAATHNSVLIDLYRSLRERQLRMGVVNLLDDSGGTVDAGRIRKSITGHERIVQAIASRSIRAAEAAIDEHLDHASHVVSARVVG